MDIKTLGEKYGLDKAKDVWNCQGSWVISHDAVERIAVQENIELVSIEVLSSEWDFCRLLIKMKKGNKTETTIGEALLKTGTEMGVGANGKPKYKGNCESQYIGAMAEKRGKDRAILKLINAYEYGISSDSEDDGYNRKANKNEKSNDRIALEKEAVTACGDNVATANAIIKELGLNGRFTTMTDDELIKFIDKAKENK